ncbi:SA1362 family protein [Sutcliffiella cohnii]
MKSRTKTIILWTILSLAIIYLISELFTNTRGLLTQLLIIVGAATVFYLVFRHFIAGRIGGGANGSKYKKAVKQSKKKYQAKPAPSTFNMKNRAAVKSKPQKATKPKRKTATHLTVIEGKKGKKKNRAFF